MEFKMKLKTAAKIETGFRVMIFILLFPFEIIRQLLKFLIWPFEQLFDWCICVCHGVGNKLLKNSEEVISGQICNQSMIKTETARRMNILWQNENKKYLDETRRLFRS